MPKKQLYEWSIRTLQEKSIEVTVLATDEEDAMRKFEGGEWEGDLELECISIRVEGDPKNKGPVS